MKRRPYKEILKPLLTHLNIFENIITCLLLVLWLRQLDKWFIEEASALLAVLSLVLCEVFFLQPFTIMKEETRKDNE